MADPSNPNYLVTPDTKIQVLPSSDDINQGGNVKFESDVGQFSFYSGTTIHTAIDQTFQAVHAPTSMNIREDGHETISMLYTDTTSKEFNVFYKYSGDVEFDINLRGTTRLRNIFFTFIADMIGIVLPNIAQVGDTTPDGVTERITRAATALVSPPGQEKIYNVPQPELVNLDFIKRIDVWIGSNKLTFENENMLEVKDRKIHASSLNLDRNEELYTAHLGTRNAVLQFRKDNARTNLAYYGGSDTTQAIGALDPAWIKLISNDNVSTPEQMYEKHFNQDLNYINSNYPANISTINFLYNQPTNRNYVLPLWLMIPFFNQYNACLPSQTPVKLRMEFSWVQWYDEKETNPNNFLLNALTDYTICTSNALLGSKPSIPRVPVIDKGSYEGALQLIQRKANSMMGDSSTSFYLPGQAFQKISSSCELIYEHFMLSEELNQSINAAWNLNPMTFNYLSWKKFPFESIRVFNNSIIMQNIIQNWNMPLQIFIRLTFNGPANIDNYLGDIMTKNNADSRDFQVNSYPVGQTSAPMINSLGTAKAPGIYNFKSGSAGGFAITSLRIYDGGMCIQDIQNFKNQSMTAYEVMQQSYNPFLNKPYQCVGNQVFSSANLNQVANGYKITLVPSRNFEIGSYPLDKGPRVLRFEITFKEPLKTGYSLNVYTSNPEQMTIDRTYQATTYKWPAVLAQVTNSKIISFNQN